MGCKISKSLYLVFEDSSSKSPLQFEVGLIGLSIAVSEFCGLSLPESTVLKEAQDSSCIAVPQERGSFSNNSVFMENALFMGRVGYMFMGSDRNLVLRVASKLIVQRQRRGSELGVCV